MDSSQVRQSFLDFFKSKGHVIVPSAPMVIKNDPTLMFTNAGMNPFKDIFLGNAPVVHPRVADTQKCLRVSGKHNDLEEVGVDTYHHTMFEMLGNWSFGDPSAQDGIGAGYFKAEAISWAWELLTEVYKIPKDRLYVTVFEGSKSDNLPVDEESKSIWNKFISEERILLGSKKDNFWEMGDTGPCGPCTEIHVDIRDDTERKKTDGKNLVNSGNPQVIEIWNNVFIEFNRKAGGSLEKLPARHVDTGMGFERLCMVLQGKKSTYDTDVFQGLIKKNEDLSGLRYRPAEENKQAAIINTGMRVAADHIRAISFSIADGQLPSNTGAGYVIRRILRRAVRYGYQSLGLKEPFLFRLVPVLASQMGKSFPELTAQKLLIEKVIKEEEISFYRTLEQGLKKIDQVCIEIVNRKEKKTIEGDVVFELYDTYGFPVDLTSLIAKGYGLGIDEEGFKRELEKQKTRSREAGKVEAGDWEGLLQTNVSSYELVTENVVYDNKYETETRLNKFRKVLNKGKELYEIVLIKTPFYAESGGQVGDTGELVAVGGTSRIKVLNAKKEHGDFIIVTDKLPKEDDHFKPFKAIVDKQRRLLIMNNHSATHLLHAALRSVLGTHVEQKGSLVNEEHLRFDFSHFAKMTEEEIAKVEAMVNGKIRENISSRIEVMPIVEAKKKGAMALFGEKYGDEVRVVTFDENYSIELCGGTHVEATGQIGYFKITSESAIAAGVRRIEAITAKKAEEYINAQLSVLNELRTVLKSPKDLVKSVSALAEQNSDLQKQLEKLLMEKARMIKKDLLGKIQLVNGIHFLAEKIELDSAEAIKNLSFEIKNEKENLFMVLGAEVNGKPSLSIIVSENLVKEKNLNAGVIVRELAKEIQGGGGGQPFYATAGGSNSQGIVNALEKSKSYVKG